MQAWNFSVLSETEFDVCIVAMKSKPEISQMYEYRIKMNVQACARYFITVFGSR